MTYDAALRRLVLFGGSIVYGGTDPGGVQEWNGTTWQLALPPRCATSGLDIWMNTQVQHIAASSFTTIYLTNLSGHPCTLRGVPAVAAVSLTGTRLGSPATTPGFRVRTVTLAAGATATAALAIDDPGDFAAPQCQPVTAAGLRVRPPGQAAAKVIPYPFAACSRPGPAYLSIGPIMK